MQERQQQMKEHHKKHAMVCVPAREVSVLRCVVIVPNIYGVFGRDIEASHVLSAVKILHLCIN